MHRQILKLIKYLTGKKPESAYDLVRQIQLEGDLRIARNMIERGKPLLAKQVVMIALAKWEGERMPAWSTKNDHRERGLMSYEIATRLLRDSGAR